MKNLTYGLGLALVGLASPAFAQTSADALRYSQTRFGGPARSLGIAGANTALGADLGNLTSNPAGLGLFQQSELIFAPGVGIGNTSSRADGSTGSTADARNSVHIGSLAAAFTLRQPDNDGRDWRGGSFGVGFTRINDFNQRFGYANQVGPSRSLLQYFRESPATLQELDKEYGTNGNNITTLDGLGYATYLIKNINGNVPAGQPGRVAVVSAQGPIAQTESVLTTGSQSQFDLAYGASYRDRLYIGAGLGIVGMRYQETKEYAETAAGVDSAFHSLALRDEVKTTGTGYNLRIGAIYRVTDAVRLGASVQSPTWYGMTDTYSSSLRATYNPGKLLDGSGASITEASARTLPGEYQYQLTTPWRVNGGVAAVISKYGFVTADVEYVDYRQARFSEEGNVAAGNPFNSTNQRIDDLYQGAVNVRLGAEGRFDIFRVRAGYARYGDPYSNSEFDRTQHYFTGGVGLRQQRFFLDVAGVYGKANRYYQPYRLADNSQPRITVDANRFTTTVSVGVLF